MVHEPDDPLTVQVAPPGDAVTRREVGAKPLPGGTTLIVAWPLPPVTVGAKGRSGAPIVMEIVFCPD